jgi:signal transduction histidine kinase
VSCALSVHSRVFRAAFLFLDMPARPMRLKPVPLWLSALLVWLGLSLAYATWLLGEQRAATLEAFETQSRIVHRLLTQRAEQHEAILAALIAAELSMGTSSGLFETFAASLQRAYPQVASIERYRKTAQGRWQQIASQPTPPLSDGVLEALPERPGQGPLNVAAAEPGHYRLLRRSQHGSIFALRIASERLLQPEELPPPFMGAELSASDGLVLWQLPVRQPSWTGLAPLLFSKHLGSQSQPFLLTSRQAPLPEQLPWLRLGMASAMLLMVSLLSCWAMEQYRQSSIARRQLALAQASRINTMGELAAGIAHELNQPLAAMLANSQALANFIADDPPDLPGAHQAAGNLARQAKRAGAIVHRLRQFMSPHTPQAESVELRGVVEGALALTRETLRRQQIKVHASLPSGLPPALGDAIGFEQVLVNLLLNAAEAMSGQPLRRLDVSLTREARSLRLDVADSGPGLSSEAANRLFEPFFTTKQGGLGLGLTICSSIVEQAGGQLSVASRPAGGCLFSVTLPIAMEALD